MLIERLLEAFPDKPWDWDELGSYLPIQTIEKYKENILEYTHPTPLSVNEHIFQRTKNGKTYFEENDGHPSWFWGRCCNECFIEIDISRCDCADYLSCECDMCINGKKGVCEFRRHFETHEYGLSENPGLTVDIVDQYSDRPWEWNVLLDRFGKNKAFVRRYESNFEPRKLFGSVSDTYLKDYVNRKGAEQSVAEGVLKFVPMDWVNELVNDQTPEEAWQDLSENPRLTKEMVYAFPRKPWGPGAFSVKGLSTEFIVAYIQTNGIRKGIARSPATKLGVLDSFEGWDWAEVSENPNLTQAFLDRNLDKPMSWERMCSNPAFPVNFLVRYMGHQWTTGAGETLMKRKDYTVENVTNVESFIPVDYRPKVKILKKNVTVCNGNIYTDPTVTFEHIQRYDKVYGVDWQRLSWNRFDFTPLYVRYRFSTWTHAAFLHECLCRNVFET